MKQHEKKQIDVCWQSGISEIVGEKYESNEDVERSRPRVDNKADRRVEMSHTGVTKQSRFVRVTLKHMTIRKTRAPSWTMSTHLQRWRSSTGGGSSASLSATSDGAGFLYIFAYVIH